MLPTQVLQTALSFCIPSAETKLRPVQPDSKFGNESAMKYIRTI